MRGCIALTAPVLAIIVAGALIIHGTKSAIQTAAGIAEGIQAQDWPKTTGRIVAVDTEVSHGEDSTTTTYTTSYTYTVDGQVYQSHRIHPNCLSTSDGRYGRQLQDLKAHASPVVVYYQLTKPERSTLAVGFFGASLASLALSLTMVIFGLAVALLGVGFSLPKEDFVAAIQAMD